MIIIIIIIIILEAWPSWLQLLNRPVLIAVYNFVCVHLRTAQSARVTKTCNVGIALG